MGRPLTVQAHTTHRGLSDITLGRTKHFERRIHCHRLQSGSRLISAFVGEGRHKGCAVASPKGWISNPALTATPNSIERKNAMESLLVQPASIVYQLHRL
jgi:hypothetical protein